MKRSTFYRLYCALIASIIAFAATMMIFVHRAKADNCSPPGCLFVIHPHSDIAVLSNDKQVRIHELHPGDNVCVIGIEEGWLATHWTSAGGHEHGGWIWSNVYKDTGAKAPSAPDDDD